MYLYSAKTLATTIQHLLFQLHIIDRPILEYLLQLLSIVCIYCLLYIDVLFLYIIFYLLYFYLLYFYL
jgi:hypothetical protein